MVTSRKEQGVRRMLEAGWTWSGGWICEDFWKRFELGAEGCRGDTSWWGNRADRSVPGRRNSPDKGIAVGQVEGLEVG